MKVNELLFIDIFEEKESNFSFFVNGKEEVIDFRNIEEMSELVKNVMFRIWNE